MNYSEILTDFGINDELCCIKELEKGHINTTFLINTSSMSLIMQSLNRNVFKNYKAVMKNAELICKIFKKHPDSDVAVPEYFHTISGANYAVRNNEVFRIYRYIENEPTANSIYKASYAYGKFIKIISDEKKAAFQIPIKNFHNFQSYFKKLTLLEKEAPLKRIDKSIIARMSSLNETLHSVFELNLTKRIVHNDAKPDNILFGNQFTVIDLDTVTEGFAATDYGDLIRSATAGGALNLNTIQEATDGFCKGLNGLLSDDEIVSLYYGILYITGELAMRYLIDYLSGEGYFKGKTSSMCLTRANELLNQLSFFINYGEDITSIIYKVFEKQ